eukprot:TRINITY_DN38933_c0_g1_i1.p1 TRINITY_DN38933_c0_g1~~TRINITY_DN38933_c0_g1_i1.p1  ORF type:complete len:378 (+),score=49.81 TRINITY_DN38933_c0_g1_i1:82-1215(+)
MGLCQAKQCQAEFCLCDNCSRMRARRDGQLRRERDLSHSRRPTPTSEPTSPEPTQCHPQPLSAQGHLALCVFVEASLDRLTGWETFMWRAVSKDCLATVNACATSLTVPRARCSAVGRSLLDSMPALRSLSLRNSPSINNDFVARVLKDRPLLQSLDLSFCPKVTEVNLNRTSLRHLKLAGTGISDQALSRVLEACPNLVELDVTLCSELTPRAFKACGAYRLRSLSVANCWQLDDTALASLAGCGTLTELNLAGCEVSDSGVLSVLQRNKQLTALNLTGCVLVTDLVLEPLVWLAEDGELEACPELETFNLSECPHVTDAKIEQLQQQRPELTLFGIRARRLLSQVSRVGRTRSGSCVLRAPLRRAKSQHSASAAF